MMHEINLIMMYETFVGNASAINGKGHNVLHQDLRHLWGRRVVSSFRSLQSSLLLLNLCRPHLSKENELSPVSLNHCIKGKVF